MIDRKGTGGLSYRGNGFERDELASGRAHKNFREVVRILLERGVELQDHGVIIARRVDCRNLPRSERIVERGAYLFSGEAERCRLLAIDVDDRLRALDLQIRSHVLQDGKRAHLRFDQRGKVVKLVEIAGLQRVLVKAPGRSDSDVEVLDWLEKHVDARH